VDGVRTKWQGAGAGARYLNERWRSRRRRERDPALVTALLAEHLVVREGTLLLDAACGAGRVSTSLARFGRCVGIDVSAEMLAEARKSSGSGRLLRGDVARLPFRDATFDAVVCCRLLHHMAEPEALASVLGELVRVSRDLVIASFLDAGSLPAWRARVFPPVRPPRRWARPRTELAQALARAGAEVVSWKHSLRFVSRQAFVAARKRRG
jgi:SAM-dependent methyltransferase